MCVGKLCVSVSCCACVSKLCVCVTKLYVGKWSVRKWCVSKLCVGKCGLFVGKLYVGKWCVSKWCVGELCVCVRKWCVGKWCVGQRCVGKSWMRTRRREEEEEADGSTQPKTRTPHKDVGKKRRFWCTSKKDFQRKITSAKISLLPHHYRSLDAATPKRFTMSSCKRQ